MGLEEEFIDVTNAIDTETLGLRTNWILRPEERGVTVEDLRRQRIGLPLTKDVWIFSRMIVRVVLFLFIFRYFT